MNHRPGLTNEAASKALREAGLNIAPGELAVEAREDRFAVMLPAERMAWFAANARGRERLAVERKVLRLLAKRCGFAAPCIIFESASGDFDVRMKVAGRHDPWGLYEQIRSDRALAGRIGRAISAILVEQHTRINAADVRGWLPTRVSWPEPGDWIRARLPGVIHDRRLIGRLERLLESYERVAVDPDDCVLVHADLGLHNIVVAPDTAEVCGVFDYDGAAWADRHHDFRYLIFHSDHEEALDAAIAAYAPAVGRPIDRDRVLLYNAACAVSYLAYRRGVPSDVKHCGRTLAEDLAWIDNTLAKLRFG